MYGKDKSRRRGTAKSEGVENGYFGVLTAKGDLDEGLETTLAAREDRARDVLVMAPNRTFVWTEPYRKVLADYVALLYARTKTRRAATALVSGAVSKDMSRLLDDQEFIHQLAREMKQPIATARAAVAEEANSAATAGEKRGFFLTELLGTAEWIAQQIFLPRPWQSQPTAVCLHPCS